MNTKTNKNKIIGDSYKENLSWLNIFPAFSECPPKFKDKLSSNAKLITFSKGDYLIKRGDVTTGIFCIEEGIVKVSKKNKRNKEFILWIAGKGDIVGLNSLIEEEPSTLSITALNPVKTYFIKSDILKILLQKNPVVSVGLMKNFCDKLNFIEHKIGCISGKNTREYSAEVFINLATKSQTLNDSNFYVNFSVNDLASIIGTTKNYLYKILVEFTDKKIISLCNRKLVINNMNALLSIATGAEHKQSTS